MISLNKIKKILVIKLRHHGDVLLTTPLFSALKKALPEAEVGALIYRDSLEILKGHPLLTQIHTCQSSRKKGLFHKLKDDFALWKELRQHHYDLAINLTEGDRGAIASLFGKIPYRLGIDPDKRGFLGKSSLYTQLIKQPLTPRHTVERHLDALRCLGISPSLAPLFFPIPQEAITAVEEKLKAAHLQPFSFVLCHLVSRWMFKAPPLEWSIKCLRALAAQGKTIVLSSGPAQKELEAIEKLQLALPDIPLVSFAGKTSLKELGALISLSQALISVDSLPIHLASALGTPLIALFGPSCEKTWGPWLHPRSQVLASPFPCRPCHLDGCGGSKISDCLAHLSIDTLLTALNNLIQSR